jgi:nucleoside-diphosphate-sugar epimerase
MTKLKPIRQTIEGRYGIKPNLKILITGGAGYLGTVLCEQLLARAEELGVEKITVLDNLLYKQDGLFPLLTHPKLEFIFMDVREYGKLKKLVDQSDVIIPLAAIVGMPACDRNSQAAWEINCQHIKAICVWVEGRGKKIIYPDTNSLYGSTDGLQMITEESPIAPISVYGKSKYEAEKAVLAAGGIAFRLATVFGTSYRFRKDLLVNDFVLKAITDKYIVLFESHFKRNFIHIRDVVDAFILMIQNYEKYQGQVFNVGLGSANLSKLELCEAIKKHIPDFVIKQDEFAKDFDKRNYIVSNTKLEAMGWSPKRDLDFGIKELIKSYEIIKNSNTKYTNL